MFHAHLDRLPVVDFDNVEVETVHSFSRSDEDAGCWIKMTANVHQDLEAQANSVPFASLRNLHSSTKKRRTGTHLVKVDGHGTIAHL